MLKVKAEILVLKLNNLIESLKFPYKTKIIKPHKQLWMNVSIIFISFLTLSWRWFLSFRNHSIDWQSKSMDWILNDRDLCHKRVKFCNIDCVVWKDSETVVHRCSAKKLRVLFCKGTSNLFGVLCFPVIFAKLLRTTFLTEHLQFLLLKRVYFFINENVLLYQEQVVQQRVIFCYFHDLKQIRLIKPYPGFSLGYV